MVDDPDAVTTTGHRDYRYPMNQRAATLWYHDHRMGATGTDVWNGLAGFHLIRDDEEQALPLPSGDRDIPLMVADRSFNQDGSFRSPDTAMEGALGDVILVNGAPWPELEVSAVRYRFRVLNASNARRYELSVGAPIVQIGSDGGLLAGPVVRDTVMVAPAERADVIIDFSRWAPGSVVTVINKLGVGSTRSVMRFRVVRRAADDSHIPAVLSEIEPLPSAVVTRAFDFRLTRPALGDPVWTINGQPFDSDADLATPVLDSVERWTFTSDFHHPVHMHLAHFQVESRNGRPAEAYERGWKDTVDVRPFETVSVLARFSGFRGRYMLHCHNLEHEDMAMMANFRVV
jgi:FtsP/CotA-like multicopper oxidase with cupredoxin domain